MWLTYYILISFIILEITSGQPKVNKRQRRYLLFTPSTQWGVFATVSVPLHPETTVSVAWFFEANYYNVDNATYFEPLLGDIYTSRSREQRSITERKEIITRGLLYEFLESMLQKHNYGAGRDCLLRAICENAATNLLHHGLLGDIMHLVLTPSTSISEDEIDDSFYEAEFYGTEDNCNKYISDCPYDPLQYITTHVDKLL